MIKKENLLVMTVACFMIAIFIFFYLFPAEAKVKGFKSMPRSYSVIDMSCQDVFPVKIILTGMKYRTVLTYTRKS